MQYTVTIDTEHRVGRIEIKDPPGKIAWYSTYKYFSGTRDYTIEIMFESGHTIRVPWFDTQAELTKEHDGCYFITCLEDYEEN